MTHRAVLEPLADTPLGLLEPVGVGLRVDARRAIRHLAISKMAEPLACSALRPLAPLLVRPWPPVTVAFLRNDPPGP
jgi:hypothetical protein